MCSVPSCAPHTSLPPLRHTTKKKVGKWPSTNLAKASENDSLLHHKSIGEDDIRNKHHMREISISEILREINPKNRKLGSGLPKSQSPKVVSSPLLHKICEDKSDDVKIVEIQARMWKIWLIKNHEWMETFHPNVGWKKIINKNEQMEILDENLPFRWKLEK